MFADIRSAMISELFMEFGNAESRDEATGLISGCSERGECLIYSEAGDIVGRSCSISSQSRALCTDCTQHTQHTRMHAPHVVSPVPSSPALLLQRVSSTACLRPSYFFRAGAGNGGCAPSGHAAVRLIEMS